MAAGPTIVAKFLADTSQMSGEVDKATGSAASKIGSFAKGAALALGVSWRFGGIWFVPVLLAFAALDFFLARRVPPVVICYRCDTEYRGVPGAADVRAYDPHVAERFAETKTVRRMNP